MSENRPIGGFFQIELGNSDFPHSEGVLLNSGRNCFEYILDTHDAKHVYLPKYTCDVMLEPLERLGIPYSFYSVNEHLEIAEEIEPKEGGFIVYTNYFGIKDDYTKKVSETYGSKLIVDNSQAFYAAPRTGIHTFYSPRKFFGLPDGGIVITDKAIKDLPVDTSFERMTHLLKRVDVGPKAAYEDFKVNDASLSGQPLRQMSKLTHALMQSIDYDSVREARLSNFAVLHDALETSNLLEVKVGDGACPMVYPYLIEDESMRQKLIDRDIFVATYWPNVFEWADKTEVEYRLVKNLLLLPIDQRYEAADMERIVGVIREHTA